MSTPVYIYISTKTAHVNENSRVGRAESRKQWNATSLIHTEKTIKHAMNPYGKNFAVTIFPARTGHTTLLLQAPKTPTGSKHKTRLTESYNLVFQIERAVASQHMQVAYYITAWVVAARTHGLVLPDAHGVEATADLRGVSAAREGAVFRGSVGGVVGVLVAAPALKTEVTRKHNKIKGGNTRRC